MTDAESRLREAGHTDLADTLRDEHIPAGVFEDYWTYELVEAFKRDLFSEMTTFEAEIRERLAGGREHSTEREQQRSWCEGVRDETDG